MEKTMKSHLWRSSCLVLLVLSLLIYGCSDGDQGAPFQDTFEDPNSGWGTDQRQEFDRGYEEGEYSIHLYAENWFVWARGGAQFGDVILEVDAYPAPGSSDGHFGALCRYADEGNFYYFAITADGYYAIFRRENGGNLDVLTGDSTGMVYSPAIRTDGQINRIKVTCQGDELSLYVNSELVDGVTDDAHSRGGVGLGAGSGSMGDVRIQFDDFVATTP